MSDAYFVLLVSAASVGIIHTALGIDHFVPFVVLSKARQWSLTRTMTTTAVCGLGHVISSVLIAGLGLSLGVASTKLEWIDQQRGSWAAGLLIAFGFGYALIAHWKSRRASPPHDHAHEAWQEGQPEESTLAPVPQAASFLFVIFLLGPCEALLPLLTASGMTLNFTQAAGVTLCFSLSTLTTMLGLVLLGYWGVSIEFFRSRQQWLHRHTHTIAGLTIAVSGITIQVLGI